MRVGRSDFIEKLDIGKEKPDRSLLLIQIIVLPWIFLAFWSFRYTRIHPVSHWNTSASAGGDGRKAEVPLKKKTLITCFWMYTSYTVSLFRRWMKRQRTAAGCRAAAGTDARFCEAPTPTARSEPVPPVTTGFALWMERVVMRASLTRWDNAVDYVQLRSPIRWIWSVGSMWHSLCINEYFLQARNEHYII